MFEKRFNTWNEFVDYAENAPSELSDNERPSHNNLNGDYESFTNARDWEHVLKLAREGWAEGLEQSKDISSVMFGDVSQMIERMDVTHDIEGHSIDIGRFVDGEPESWLKFENVIEESGHGNKLIKITFNCCVSFGVSTDVIIRKGAAIATLIELLEYSGHRVELILVEAVRPHSFENIEIPPEFLVFVKLKTFDQNCDMANISYALSHPSVSRALMFSVAETSDKETRAKCDIRQYGSYGVPTDILKSDRGDIHVGYSRNNDQQWNSAEKAEKWIIEQLKIQGVHLKKEIKI